MSNKNMRMILFINFLVMGSFNMAHPVTPSLMNELMMPAYMFGVMYSTMAVAHFLMSPVWGKMSDQKGRKKFLAVGMIGYGISQLGFGFSTSSAVILFFRFAGGVMSVAYMVSCIAYVSDLSTPQDRTKYMSYHTATSAIGSSIGALLGGYLGTYGYKTSFFAQFIITIIIAGIIWISLDETVEVREGKLEIYTQHLKKRDKSNKLAPVIALMMIVMTFITIAITSYNSTINYYVESVLNMPTIVNGIVMSIAGMVALIANLVLNPYLSKKYDEKKTLMCASLVAGFGIFGATLFKNIFVGFGFLLLFVLCSALVTPIQQSIVSKLSQDNYGEILGIQGSYKAIGMIVGSLASGFIFDIGNKLPFVLSGICCMIIVFLMSKVIHKNRVQ